MARPGLRVKGLRETVRAANRAADESGKALKKQLARAGETIRLEWTRRFSKVDANSASGFRTRVSARGVRVVQSKRRKTGRRPDYGAKQMRYGLGVMFDKEAEIVRDTEAAFEDIANDFTRN